MIKYNANDDNTAMIITIIIICLCFSSSISGVVVAIMDPFGFFKKTNNLSIQSLLQM